MYLGCLGEKRKETEGEMGRNGQTQGVLIKMNVMLLKLSRRLNMFLQVLRRCFTHQNMLLWLCIAMGLVITQNSEKSRRNSFPGICKTEHLLNIILMSFLSQTIESPFMGRELATENNKQSKVLHWA